jgi:uncharacterized repeat protein (TIGR02543 family)
VLFRSSAVSGIAAGSTGDKTFYAKWTPITYTVQYNANGGTGTTASSAHTYGTARTLSANGFTRTGYTFGGWAAQADGGGTGYTDEQSVSDLSSTQDATVNLYAKWTAITYAISYELYGSTNPEENPASYTIESAAITFAAPTRTGYTFKGWYDNAAFTGSAVTGIPIGSTGNKTLYAQWWPDVSVNVTVWVNQDSNILSASTNNVTISKSGSGEKPTSFTAEVTSAYSDVQWYLYGEPGPVSTAQSVTVNAEDCANGTYYLEVTVTKDGVPYSTNIQFMVVN